MATGIIPIVPCAPHQIDSSVACGGKKEVDDSQVVSEVLIALYANVTGNTTACCVLCCMMWFPQSPVAIFLFVVSSYKEASRWVKWTGT